MTRPCHRLLNWCKNGCCKHYYTMQCHPSLWPPWMALASILPIWGNYIHLKMFCAKWRGQQLLVTMFVTKFTTRMFAIHEKLWLVQKCIFWLTIKWCVVWVVWSSWGDGLVHGVFSYEFHCATMNHVGLSKTSWFKKIPFMFLWGFMHVLPFNDLRM